MHESGLLGPVPITVFAGLLSIRTTHFIAFCSPVCNIRQLKKEETDSVQKLYEYV